MFKGEEGKVNPTRVPEKEQPVLGERRNNPFSEVKGRKGLEGGELAGPWYHRGAHQSTSHSTFT